jgi:glycosyltransferase involved in cell wall biosynthesis
MPTPYSVVVLTLNEAANIAQCLDSAADADEVFVVDSGSTDATVAIAAARGARVATNPFSSFGQQRNWAHDSLPLAHDWVLHLDADERLTLALLKEATARVLADDGSLAGFYLAERTLLQGSWLRHAGQYPRYQARLVHRRRMRFVDHGHGQREFSALPFGTLAAPYDHHAFSHGVEAWLRKHAGYAAREAQQILEAHGAPPRLSTLWSSDRIAARRAAKYWAMKLPFRPSFRWLQIMIMNGGLLDGAPGREYARMMMTFQQMIDLCLHEARENHLGRSHAPTAVRELGTWASRK